MASSAIKGLYYITHIDNIPSILKLGILSHNMVEKEGLHYTPIYDAQIVSNRHAIKVPDGRTLWSFANVYFQPRNPMLYRVLCEKDINDIAILSLHSNILYRKDIYISAGNAACTASEILPAKEGLKIIHKMKDDISKEWWKEEDGSKRKIMAECLVPDVILSELIKTIYVASHDTAIKLKQKLGWLDIPIISEPKMFFLPNIRTTVTPYLFVVEGDMFFSRHHTLTVSVNVVGIMGKGVASRAKYQFPDVYVFYQDLCRNRTLKMGKPYLYKREASIDYQLADEPATLTNLNSEKWFLLFPTKNHWREKSDIKGIEEGLQWILDNYRKEGIKSLAIPALGCGLGWLEWSDVGPLLCKYLSTLDIPVSVYLPTEKKIDDKFLTKDFLLRLVKQKTFGME